MSPKIDNHSAGIGVDRAQQCFQRVEKSDHEHARAERLQILRHETHPEFFACADHEDRNEQDGQVALQSKKTRDSCEGTVRRRGDLRFFIRRWRISLGFHLGLVGFYGRSRRTLSILFL